MLTGESNLFMLDAKKSATKLRRTTADDSPMFETFENIYAGTSHEKSRLRIVQGI